MANIAQNLLPLVLYEIRSNFGRNSDEIRCKCNENFGTDKTKS